MISAAERPRTVRRRTLPAVVCCMRAMYRQPESPASRSERATCSRRTVLSDSLDCIAECLCILSNPSVPCHDHDQRRWLAKQLRRGQVHGIERTNRLDRKRSADASENRVCDTHQITAKLETTEGAHCHPLFVHRQPCSCSRPKNRACGFGDRQSGRDLRSSSTERFQCVRVGLEQRGDQRAGLDVSDTSGFRDRMRHFGSTLRHDRRQSTRRRFPPQA